ncbi:MAG: hypothetical protein ACYC1T_13810 [Sulfuricaulis sp.]
MKRILCALMIGLLIPAALAEEKTAEQMVAAKKRADMTYRQLMEIMGTASAMIHQGIIRENKQMVVQGADMITNHPAPNHQPWIIVPEEDRASFKQTLLAFDKILDDQTARVATAAGSADWQGAARAAQELTSACIACHAQWKHKVK